MEIYIYEIIAVTCERFNVHKYTCHPSGSCFPDSNLCKIHAFQNILDTLEICSKNVSCALKQCMPVSVSYTDTSFSDSIISEAQCFAF